LNERFEEEPDMKMNYVICKLTTIFFAALFAGGCAGIGTTGSKYMDQKIFSVPQIMTLEEATLRGAKAIQDMGGLVIKQTDSAGFLSAKITKGWWVNKISYFLEVHLSLAEKGKLKAHASSVAGPEVAYTDELDDLVNDFLKAFEKALTE
jgi:hypothetical protein